MNGFWTFSPKHKQNKQANSFALIPFNSTWMVPRKLLFIFSVLLTFPVSPLLMESETEDCNSLFFSPSCCCLRFKSHCITATTWWPFTLSLLYRFFFFLLACEDPLAMSLALLPCEVAPDKTMGMQASSCYQRVATGYW